jgi:hypothetical protein
MSSVKENFIGLIVVLLVKLIDCCFYIVTMVVKPMRTDWTNANEVVTTIIVILSCELLSILFVVMIDS